MVQSRSDQRVFGGILVALSAIMYSTAGIFTRVISADVWTMLCIRGVFAALFLFAYLLFTYKGRVFEIFSSLNWWVFAATLSSAIAMILNLGAYRNTAVANVVVIYAMSPFISAALAWLVIREPLQRHTLVASLISLGGVAIMMGGSLVTHHLFGDFLALGMTIFMACMVVAIRSGGSVDMIPASFLSAIASAVITYPFSSVASVGSADWKYLALFGVSQLGLGLLFLTEGSRRIPASQVALIGALDIPFAIALVWTFYGEVPPHLTILGGAIVLLAVFGHMMHDYFQLSSKPNAVSE